MSSISEANKEIISELNSSLARVKFGKVDFVTSTRESTAKSEKADQQSEVDPLDQVTTVVDGSEAITEGVCCACVCVLHIHVYVYTYHACIHNTARLHTIFS